MTITPLAITSVYAGGTFLIHGAYGAGKTSLLGDMLRTESAHGPTRFINLRGEDGFLSIPASTLEGANGVTVETFEDLEQALIQAKTDGCTAIGIDGFHRLYPLAYKKVLGSDRLPVVGGTKNEWSDVHKVAETLVESLRYHAPTILCTSASDKSLDQLRGELHTTPNFPGRNAAGIAGFFDFVFYMESEVIGPAKIRRKLLTAPVSKMVVRYRLPRPLPPAIEIPDNAGGWALIVAAINRSLKGDGA